MDKDKNIFLEFEEAEKNFKIGFNVGKRIGFAKALGIFIVIITILISTAIIFVLVHTEHCKIY